MGMVFRVIRAFFRIWAMLLLLKGIGALVFFVLVLRADDGLATEPLGRVWLQHDPLAPWLTMPSLQVFANIAQPIVHPFLWNEGIIAWLKLPSWLGLLMVAGICLFLSALLFILTKRKQAA